MHSHSNSIKAALDEARARSLEPALAYDRVSEAVQAAAPVWTFSTQAWSSTRVVPDF